MFGPVAIGYVYTHTHTQAHTTYTKQLQGCDQRLLSPGRGAGQLEKREEHRDICLGTTVWRISISENNPFVNSNNYNKSSQLFGSASVLKADLSS